MRSRGYAFPSHPARELVELAQSGLSFEQFAENVLAIFDRAIGCDSAVLMRQVVSPALVGWQMTPEQLAYARRSQELAQSRYAPDLERLLLVSETQGACIDREIISFDELKKTRLFREVIEPAKLRSMLHVCARWQGRSMLRINLARHGRQRFRQRELERALVLLPTLEAGFVAFHAADTFADLRLLTVRELEVARHVARGLTSPQIAYVLGTSKFTVRNQLVSIFDKLKVASRAELAAYMASKESTLGLPLLPHR